MEMIDGKENDKISDRSFSVPMRSNRLSFISILYKTPAVISTGNFHFSNSHFNFLATKIHEGTRREEVERLRKKYKVNNVAMCKKRGTMNVRI